MKKTILITLGILIILLIIAVWAYLFTFGAPKSSSEVFSHFTTSGDQLPVVTPQSTVDVSPETNTGAPKKLRQLTTKPVAGAVFTDAGLRYVEKGTGHIYDINLTTGVETLTKGTTIPQSSDAVFSSDGRYVAISSHSDSGDKTILEEISVDAGTKNTEGIALPEGARDVYFGDATSSLMYAIKEASGVSGYTYNINKGSGVQVFNIPLRDIRVLWGSPLYVYTTPSGLQSGYLYQVAGSDMKYVSKGGNGLTALRYQGGVVVTTVGDTDVSSRAIATTSKERKIPLTLIPEKCTHDAVTLHSLICSAPYTVSANDFPDAWYKGAVAFSDALWRVDMQSGRGLLLSDFLSESGRKIDVSHIGTNETGTFIYFINKNDNTLWMFDTTTK